MNVVCQADNNKILSPDQMQEDIDYYITTIKKYHPQLYHRYSEQEIDSLCGRIREKCRDSLSVRDFRFNLAQLNHALDDHTGILHFSQFFTMNSYCYYPRFTFDDNNMYMNNYRVKAINGKDAGDILSVVNNLTSWAYGDEMSENYKNLFFECYLHDYLVMPPPYQFTIESLKDGLIRDTTIVNSPESKRTTNRVEELHSPPLYAQFFDADSIAVLYYNTSAPESYGSTEEYFDEFTTSFFEKVKADKCKYVFIDVSRNGGGNDATHRFINRYLKHGPYTLSAIVYLQLAAIISFPEYYGVADDDEELQSVTKKLEHGYFDDGMEYIEAKTDGIDAGVFVIMGTNSFSAAFDFCQMVKLSKSGILVGMPSGQRYPFAGNIGQGELPNSQTLFHYPTKYYVSKELIELGDKEGFLHPDIPYALDHPLELNDFKKIIELSKE